MNQGQKMFAQFVKAHDEAVDKYKAEMARLADEWKAIDVKQEEMARNASED